MMKPMRYHPVRPSAFTGFGFEAVMQTPTYRFRPWHDSASLLAPSTPAAPARTRSGGAA
jgi:hypothetical protein